MSLSQMASTLKLDWGIPDSLIEIALEAEEQSRSFEAKCDFVAGKNFLKVLRGFESAGAANAHLTGSHGYGYFDAGREALDHLYAAVFGGEDALVRSQFVSGTHVLRTALFGLLRPGDHLLVLPAAPYDTLLAVFGLRPAAGSLNEWGVKVSTSDIHGFLEDGFQWPDPLKAVFIQRSKGYRWQDSISIEQLSQAIKKVKSRSAATVVVVDNCYGEFVEEQEPPEVGADLTAGSLLKNPGGGICPTGGYLVGKRALVEQAAAALTAPGLGKEVGPTLGVTRNFFHGLFLAPGFVGEALKTAQFGSALFKRLGYSVLPGSPEKRTDIIQAIELESREAVLAFARGIQSAGPLDSSAVPVGAPMAGYSDPIVMAGGTFIQGGSLELSCDAPLRPPYVVYVQGGLSSLHGKLGYLLAAKALQESAPPAKRIHSVSTKYK